MDRPRITYAQAVRRDYKRACVGNDTSGDRSCGTGTELCTLENQLLDLDDPAALQPPPAEPDFAYAEPERRVNLEWASENGGDILILTDMERKYCFDKGALPSTHGSLSYKDALVPLGFSYPGATGKTAKEDNVLASVVEYLASVPPAGQAAPAPVERKAMDAALGQAP